MDIITIKIIIIYYSFPVLSPVFHLAAPVLPPLHPVRLQLQVGEHVRSLDIGRVLPEAGAALVRQAGLGGVGGHGVEHVTGQSGRDGEGQGQEVVQGADHKGAQKSLQPL